MPTERNDKLFIEWSHKVIEELTTLNGRFEALGEKYDQLRSGFDEKLNRLDVKFDDKFGKMNELLMGNGSPEKGLIVRVDRIEQQNTEELQVTIDDLKLRTDRLEQSESRRSWLMKVTIVACLGAITAVIASYFKKS